MGLNWAESQAFSNLLLRVIISNELKSLSDWGLMLKLSQLLPRCIPTVAQESKWVFQSF